MHVIPVLKDNYAFVVEGEGGACIVIDPGDSHPILAYLEKHSLRPVAILNTHHHGDHVAGNSGFSCPVIGPEKERARIPALTRGVSNNETFTCAGFDIRVMETPGHTAGHVVFYFPILHALFTGDTLFSLGCGRLFEGSAEEMFAALHKIKSLPPETNIYCGHEYTLANAHFAITVEPENHTLQKRMAQVKELQARNLPTLPVSLQTELETNPFLRAKTAQEFASLRRLKDKF